ncbi:MAG: hypothetical protein JWM80_213 [Cyanobacteria bacterium RYN_339]|nr:hypothetical protein [Cyanobacteria bacterium RYN_339]
MRIDLHVHLAGIGGGCFVSPKMRRSIVYHALKRTLKIDDREPVESTRRYAERLATLLETSKELDYACIFAMDGVYDGAGELLPAESHLYVPNGYVFEVCKASPKLLPVISINPQRKDALEELTRWGPQAVALKWLGPLQKFDASNKAYEPFYDLLKELRLPVIAHSGCEHTFPGMEQRLGDPLLYEPVVKRGIPVFFSHCGTGSLVFPGHDYSGNFISLMERYENVYGDTSAFCSLLRWHQLKRFGADKYVNRIFHGSDWPIPSSSVYFLPALGFNAVRLLERDRHPLDRDAATKRAMGLPDQVFHGAYEVLKDRIAAWEAIRTS